MSYMGLFWETGMPEAWALSRRTGDRPETGAGQQFWPQDFVALGTFPDPDHMVPGDNAGRPVPTPEGRKTKKTDDSDPAGG